MIANDEVGGQQYLSFSLAGVDCAVGILKVKEILQYETVTAVPSMPPSVRGVINLRGGAVPVIDLGMKLGRRESAITGRSCILVVETTFGGVASVVGVIADSVSEVLALGPGDIEPPPVFGTHVRADHLLGMGKVGKGFVVLLDLDEILSANEQDLVAAISAAADPDPEPAGEARAGEARAGEAAVPPEA